LRLPNASKVGSTKSSVSKMTVESMLIALIAFGVGLFIGFLYREIFRLD
jgi:hypothetical protein